MAATTTPRNLVHIDNQLIVALLSKPAIKAAFPCLPKDGKLLQQACSGCRNSALRRSLDLNRLYEAVKQCLISSTGAQRRLLGTVLNARQARITTVQGRNRTEVTIRLLPAAK